MCDQVSNTQDKYSTDSEALALRALIWTLTDPDRAMRLIGTTGIAPADLKERIGEPAVLAATIAFLEAHEPDLIACAQDLEVTPAALVDARHVLEAR